MKSFFTRYYISAIALASAIGFFLFSKLIENNFYSKTDKWLEVYRNRLEEDGFTSQQVNSVISSAERPAKLAFESINDLYNSIIMLLLVLAIIAFFRTLKLEKTVKELKNNPNV